MNDKIRLIISTLLISVALCAAAETHYMPRLSIGGRAGMSMGRMSFSPNVKQLFNNGTAGAVSFRYTEENLFGLIAEFGWIQRGWKENYETAPFSYSRTLTYLRMPLLTHIYFGSRRFKGFVNLGPEVSYMIGDKIKADFDYQSVSSRTTLQIAAPNSSTWLSTANSTMASAPDSAWNSTFSHATQSCLKHGFTTAWAISSRLPRPMSSAHHATCRSR